MKYFEILLLLSTIAQAGVEFSSAEDTKKILFIAGRPSHGHGLHEHRAGSMLLADALNNSGVKVEAKVQSYGWPKDTAIFNKVDLTVIYADAGGRMNQNVQELMDKRVKNGMGIMFIHYGVHPSPKVGEQYFLDWTGAYFKTGLSVNPHWVADITPLEGHAVSFGIKQPFKVYDEFYFNMKKEVECEHCKHLAVATPKPENILRYNNLWNKAADANFGKPQPLMWAKDPGNGVGRGVGWVGGHYHSNWAIDDFRKLTLNSIVWAAGAKVPAEGVPSEKVTKEMLNQNIDAHKPPFEIELPSQDIFSREHQPRPDSTKRYRNIGRNKLLSPSWKTGDEVGGKPTGK